MRAKTINEAIKHLAPKSKEERKKATDQLIEEMKEALKSALDFDPGEKADIKTIRRKDGDITVFAKSLDVKWSITFYIDTEMFEVEWETKRGYGDVFGEDTLENAKNRLADEYQYYMERL